MQENEDTIAKKLVEVIYNFAQLQQQCDSLDLKQSVKEIDASKLSLSRVHVSDEIIFVKNQLRAKIGKLAQKRDEFMSKIYSMMTDFLTQVKNNGADDFMPPEN